MIKMILKNFISKAISTVFILSFLVFPVVGFSEVNCDPLSPINGVRAGINLTDADFRADQDFICGYNTQVCVNVFTDVDNLGVKDSGENLIAGVVINVYAENGLSLIYSKNSLGNGYQCFTPFQTDATYRVRIVSPPTPYNTTGGNEQSIDITDATGIEYMSFGYTNGTLSLSAEQSVNLGTIYGSKNTQNVCTTVHDIQVIDTRVDKPGWAVTATMEDFQDAENADLKLPVGGKLHVTPKTATIVSGNATGISSGQSKTIASTSDQFSVMSATSNSGVGTYKIDMDICLTVDPFVRVGNYSSIINFTV